MKQKKYYRNDKEIEIEKNFAVPSFMIRWCQSPLFRFVPGCPKAFYTCEYEEHYGPVKHNPNFKKHKRIKKGTNVDCRDMPLNYCQKLIDVRTMICPHCGQKIHYRCNT